MTKECLVIALSDYGFAPDRLLFSILPGIVSVGITGATALELSLAKMVLGAQMPIGVALTVYRHVNPAANAKAAPTGASCSRCNEFNEWVDGPFTCWQCRQDPHR